MFRKTNGKGMAVPDFGDLREIVRVDVGEDLEIPHVLLGNPLPVLVLHMEKEGAAVPPSSQSRIKLGEEADIPPVLSRMVGGDSAPGVPEPLGGVDQVERQSLLLQPLPRIFLLRGKGCRRYEACA